MGLIWPNCLFSQTFYPQPANTFTRIYPSYPRHFATLALSWWIIEFYHVLFAIRCGNFVIIDIVHTFEKFDVFVYSFEKFVASVIMMNHRTISSLPWHLNCNFEIIDIVHTWFWNFFCIYLFILHLIHLLPALSWWIIELYQVFFDIRCGNFEIEFTKGGRWSDRVAVKLDTQ